MKLFQEPGIRVLSLVILQTFIAPHAFAQPGFADGLRVACQNAGLQTPGITEKDCNVCHQNSTNIRAYKDYQSSQARADLEPLCTLQGGSGGSSGSPPVFAPLDSPIRLQVGTPFTLLISAMDPDGTALKLTAKPLPPGARLKPMGQRGGKTLASLQWTPKSTNAGKRFSIELKATEKGKKPVQSGSLLLELLVGP